MKKIKIFLGILVVSTITISVIKSFVKTDTVGEIRQSGNPFVDKIQHEINELQLKPENVFCKDFYTAIAYHIDDHHQYNRLGSNKFENDQWKENLSKRLYAVYTDKFIKQTYNVFSRSEWAINELQFIRSEYQALQNSPMLEINSPIDMKLNEIKFIIKKYDEISNFISSCKAFSFLQTDLDKPFPQTEVINKISAANYYINNRMGNPYLNNCNRLRNELKTIPQVYFRAHIKYLDNLIGFWSYSFKNYNTQKAYVNGLFTPMRTKIDQLDYDIYNVSEFNREYLRLKTKWETDAKNAYEYFSPK